MNTVGNTPLVRLYKMNTCAYRVFAKIEGENPAGSIKDRVAFAILDDAEKNGRLKAGGTVVEATSGNTGIGLAYACQQRGYRAIIVMPDSMSVERRKLMADYGAEVVLTDGAKGMSAAVERAQQLVQELPLTLLDQQVGIDKPIPKPLCQQHADGAFSAGRHPDQNDICHSSPFYSVQ